MIMNWAIMSRAHFNSDINIVLQVTPRMSHYPQNDDIEY